jgi:ferritin
MLSETLETALNDQIKEELYSAYLYLSMSAHFENANLPGFAHWMRVQAQEELAHAMKFFDHIAARNGRVRLQAIPLPPVDFGSPTSIFQQALEHEQHISGRIGMLYDLSQNEKDYASRSFLQWFIDEQVEEERNAEAVIDTLKMAGEGGMALIMLDRQLGARAA